MSKRQREESTLTLPSGKVIRLIKNPVKLRELGTTGFRYAPPPPPAPQFNFSVGNTAAEDRMDIESGEQNAYNYGMGNLNRTRLPSSFYTAPRYYRSVSARKRVTPAPRRPPKGSYFASKQMMRKRRGITAAQAAASKASLARARTSAKRGGTKIPRKQAIKASRQVDAAVNYRMLINKPKSELLKALKTKTKNVLATCLANAYAYRQ